MRYFERSGPSLSNLFLRRGHRRHEATVKGGNALLLLALVVGLMVLGKPALAQQAPRGQDRGGAPGLVPDTKAAGVQYYLEHPEAPIAPELERRLPDERLARLRRQRKRLRQNGGNAMSRRPVGGKAIGGFPELRPDQSWALAENPTPSLNFDLTGTPQFAGDVDGDGTNDYVYSAGQARDERTARLEDRAAKTALFFGGNPTKEPDQLLYTERGAPLRPAGDLNGDGHDDAISVRGDEVLIYTGDSTGYTRTGELRVDFRPDQSAGFTDLDGDGYEDVVVYDPFTSGGPFEVIYGADDVGQISARRYDQRDFPDPEAFRFTYNAADLEGDGQGEIVRLAGEPPNIKVQTFEIADSTRSVTQTQSFVAGELTFFGADRGNLSLIDITGNDTLEIAAKDEFGGKAYVFERGAGSGPYAETPDSLEKGAVPVGDLDGDGNHDFFTFDGSTDTRYVSYGPDDLADGLTFDTEIPYGEDVFGTVDFLPQGGLGDVTGNGRPDVGLSLSDNANETVGRRFFSVDSNRNALSPEDVSYAAGRFRDRILSAQEIGDFNGDGTDDFAMVRFDRAQIAVFYGGSPISQTPDLTIEAPTGANYVSVASGDFNGDGAPDIAAEYNFGSKVDILFGGKGADGQVDHTISAADFELSRLEYVHAIGDVNDNGADDLLAAKRAFDGPDSLAVFFGGSTLPSTPDVTIQYDSSSSAGETVVAPGDVNGDGIDDFVVGRPDFQRGDAGTGRADVYFGGNAPTFASPDLTLLPDTSSGGVGRFSNGLAGGDFDGDGHGDIAVRPLNALEGVSISIFEGGPNVDAEADQRLVVRPETGVGRDGDRDGIVERLGGVLEATPLSGASDGLVQGSRSFGGANAVLYRPLAGSPEPAAVFRAPNPDADMGGFSNVFGGIAAGDFTGSGRPDVVFPQSDDDNDAVRSSRVYRYEVQGIPAASATELVEANGETTFGGTGLAIDFADISGEDDVSATKYVGPPVNASGLNRDDVAARYTVESGAGLSVGAGTRVRFDVDGLPVQDTGDVVIYKRSTPDEGVFAGLETTYDADAGTLSAPVESFGEFALAPSPDSVTVWAGDTDNDGTVDQADVLPLGAYWDQSGPARDATGCAWTGARAPSWTPEAATYADANGDGVVNQEDVLCLGLNWGETRSTSASAVLAGKSAGDEAAGTLVLRRVERTGSAIWVELYAQEVESVMGVATELTFDPGDVSVATVEPGARMGESAILQSNTDKATGTLGLGVSRKGTATSTAAEEAPVARIKLRSTVEDPEVSLREGRATTAKGRAVTLATDDGLNALPEEVTLKAPAPNPVRRRATLRYALPEAQQVRLTVYDVLGREVAVLVDEKQQAGTKQVTLDASRWSSGTYFYRLDAEEATITERLMIVR